MAAFGETLRRLLDERGLSLGSLSETTHYDKGYLSKISNGRRPVTDEVARACDLALGARGELIAAAHLDVAAARDSRPWETTELIQRIQGSDASTHTIEQIEATVFELCCEYPFRNAVDLRHDAQGWLRRIVSQLRKPIGLRQHQELLVAAGWLALLVGCLEYDLGMRTAAEATRTAARQLGDEAGHGEILGWSYEMSAWFALTQGRYHHVLAAAQAGRAKDSTHSIGVQLFAQEAKARARIGDADGVREALDQGAILLASLTRPERPEHHFAVDPDKWDFYAMDAYRLAGDDDRAGAHAREVLAKGTAPDGSERAPMRMAEARLTLGVQAARNGQLEQAYTIGERAFRTARRSLPSLLMVAGELASVLHARYPDEAPTRAFSELLREVR
jgi:transcriptional regulator with XRE-family HTH domain